MPYIARMRRAQLAPLAQNRPATAGELNYLFTKVATDYIKDRGLNYATINDVLGALDGASKEFYRRVAVVVTPSRNTATGLPYPVSAKN